MSSVSKEASALLEQLGVRREAFSGGELEVHSPVTGEVIGRVNVTTVSDVSGRIGVSFEAFQAWKKVPPPRRGELMHLFAEELDAAKESLGRLVTLEAGKIISEGQGEVQEMIDICRYAAGLSRQLFGQTIASERPEHHLRETWHPIGVTGVISAFNLDRKSVV